MTGELTAAPEARDDAAMSDDRRPAMDLWSKVILAIAVGGYLAFQGWLGVSAIQVGKLETAIEENREQRIGQIKALEAEDEELHDEIREVRDMVGEHRLRDAADDRGAE